MPAPTYFPAAVDTPNLYPVHPRIAALRARYTPPPPAATPNVLLNVGSFNTRHEDMPDEPWPVRAINARWRRDYRKHLLVYGELDKFRQKRSAEIPVPATLTYPTVSFWEGRRVFWSAAQWAWRAGEEEERRWRIFWARRGRFLKAGRWNAEIQWPYEKDGCLRCAVKAGGRCSSEVGLKGVWERERCGRCERAGEMCVLWRPWKFDYKKQEREDIITGIELGILTQADLDLCDEMRKKSERIPNYYGDGHPAEAGLSYALVDKAPGWPRFWAWVRKEGVGPEEVERLAREAIQGEERRFGGFLTVAEGDRGSVVMPSWKEEKSEFAGSVHYDETWKGFLDRAKSAKEVERLEKEKQDEIETREWEERRR
ncbi:hypothetical protein B0T25DRAFT_516697 [Lasiosphaeria hispida]|uniref:Uncharacterized protein n=1 Tax=Lasiosphaeria hispida TaxID=260671 RepID=A0AAJ0HM04_9PEZI|nr:hypothetical protein B0T25DRAFT_516697 [Lasiosphaeria hispida]